MIFEKIFRIFKTLFFSLFLKTLCSTRKRHQKNMKYLFFVYPRLILIADFTQNRLGPTIYTALYLTWPSADLLISVPVSLLLPTLAWRTEYQASRAARSLQDYSKPGLNTYTGPLLNRWVDLISYLV